MNRLDGKIAIVTGVATGIGQQTALRFAAEGATVIGVDIDSDGANATAERAKAAGGSMTVIAPVNLFDEHETSACIKSIGDERGYFDVLVNAAAIGRMAPLDVMTAKDFRDCIVGEVDVVFFACRAAWPYLKTKGGSIVNFSSVAAHMAVPALPAIAHTAGKGAVLAMTRQIAMEGAPFNIRANTIAPGCIVTANMEAALDGLPGFRESVERLTMLDRLGRPDDIASGCLFLASDDASFITGTDITIDGGMTAW